MPRGETAARDVEQAAHHPDRNMGSPLLHERVPGSDSLAKYAVALFNLSRAMRASARSLRNRAFSAPSAATGRALRAVAAALPLAATIRFADVPIGNGQPLRRRPLHQYPSDRLGTKLRRLSL